MNTVNVNKVLLLTALVALPATHAHAVIVDSGASSARDIFVDATVSATALGLNLTEVSVTVPALIQTSGSTSVDGSPYSKTSAINPSASVSSGLLNLNAGVTALEVSAASTGIGSPGATSTSGTARIENADVSLDALAFNLLSIDLTTPGDITSVLTSYSELVGDGTNVVPDASSNLLSTSGAVLNISVLGITLPVSLAGLSPNATVVIPIDLSVEVVFVSLTEISGFVTLRQDSFTESFNGATGLSTASALILNIDLSVSQTVPGLGTSIVDADINADVTINETWPP